MLLTLVFLVLLHVVSSETCGGPASIVHSIGSRCNCIDTAVCKGTNCSRRLSFNDPPHERDRFALVSGWIMSKCSDCRCITSSNLSISSPIEVDRVSQQGTMQRSVDSQPSDILQKLASVQYHLAQLNEKFEETKKALSLCQKEKEDAVMVGLELLYTNPNVPNTRTVAKKLCTQAPAVLDRMHGMTEKKLHAVLGAFKQKSDAQLSNRAVQLSGTVLAAAAGGSNDKMSSDSKPECSYSMRATNFPLCWRDARGYQPPVYLRNDTEIFTDFNPFVSDDVMQTVIKQSIRHRGRTTDHRLKTSMLRLRDTTNRKFTVVAFGGSATAHGQYTGMLANWIGTTFPMKDIQVINAGLGGCGASIPRFCMYKLAPELNDADLILTEFSINPTSEEDIERLYHLLHSLPRSPPIIAIDFFNGHTDPRAIVESWTGRETGAPTLSSKRLRYADGPARQAIAGNITVISATSAVASLWADTRDKRFEHWSNRTVGPFHNGAGGFIDTDGYHPSRICHLWMAHFIIEYIAAALLDIGPDESPVASTETKLLDAGHYSMQALKQSSVCNSNFIIKNSPLVVHRVSGNVSGATHQTCWQQSRGKMLPLLANPYKLPQSKISALGIEVPKPSAIPPGCNPDWQVSMDRKSIKKMFFSSGAGPSAIDSWIEFKFTPSSDCDLHLGYLLSDKHLLGSADVHVDGVNMTRIIVEVDSTFATTQEIVRIPITLHAGIPSIVRVVIANAQPRSPKKKELKEGYRFIVTGVYC